MIPAVTALDLNKDGVIDGAERRKAAESLKTLDKNGDGKLTADEYRAGPGSGRTVAAPAPEPARAADAKDTSPAALFNPKALVKPITEIEGTLSDGSKATVYKIVVRSLPVDHEVGPWSPKTIKDQGGYWEDTVDKKLYRVNGEYLALLNQRGWNMFEADGTVHRTKDRAEFDKVARQELAGWTFEQALKDGVTNSVIELQPQEQIATIFLPKNPKASAQPTLLRQARFSPRSGVGIGTDGVRFFPPEPVNRITAFQNIAPLDPFGGHTGFGHEYHYHRAPASMSDDQSGKVVGWALDGFPIRGPHEANGGKPANLDTINGHDHDGLGYHYHAGDTWPYFVGGFHGPLGTAALGDVEVCDATLQSGGGPPGRGGGGGGSRPSGGRPPGGDGPPPRGARGSPGAAVELAPTSVIPPPAASHASTKPNILLLVADDLGWGDVAFHQGNVPTPSLDRLAKDGVELQRFYVYPVCSPTRAALLSGQMPRRFGVTNVMGPQQQLPKDIVTLPAAFRSAGYATSLIGKWHLGKGASTPMQFGFDHFYGFLGPEIDYFKHTDQRGGVDWQRDGTTLDEAGYSTFLIADEVIRQLEMSDAKMPFFMQIAFNAVHVPQSAPDDLLAKYKGLGNRALGAAVLDAMDTSIGRILAALDQAKLRENTLVVFFSDNGAPLRMGSNGPQRAGKGTLYEGGIHTPCLLRWPGQIAAGSVSQQPISVHDLFPTLVAAAGVRNDARLDGLNLWPALHEGRVEKRVPFAIATDDIALIDGDWKLIEWSSGQRTLYHLSADRSETRDELTQQPEIPQRLLTQLAELKKDMPSTNSRQRPGGPGRRPR